MNSLRAAGFFALLASCLAVPAPKAVPLTNGPSALISGVQRPAGAAYFLSDDGNENIVFASAFDKSGELQYVRAIPTGGKGARHNSTGGDPLFSQGAVAVGKDKLFAVNAGSNTVSMFSIDPVDPSILVPAGVASSGGEFPLSIAVNEAASLACVVNGGKLNSVKCFSTRGGLHSIDERPLGIIQTTPANGPSGSVSQAVFSADGKQLLVSVKGIPPTPGFIGVWDVEPSGTLSKTYTAFQPAAGGASPFGIANIPGTTAYAVADPGIGFDIMDLDPKKATKSLASITSAAAGSVVVGGHSSSSNVTGQQAICWNAYSPTTGSFFFVDPGAGMLTEVSINKSTLAPTILRQYPQPSGAGALDDDVATIGGKDFLFVLGAGSAHVDVLALNAPGKATTVQSVDYTSAAKELGVALDPTNLTGMAVYVV